MELGLENSMLPKMALPCLFSCSGNKDTKCSSVEEHNCMDLAV
jgi:hypothetical protein